MINQLLYLYSVSLDLLTDVDSKQWSITMGWIMTNTSCMQIAYKTPFLSPRSLLPCRKPLLIKLWQRRRKKRQSTLNQ
jgi:hypothetical protein